MSEYIYSVYNSLMEAGWTMNDIDTMDMLGFMKMKAWKAQRDHKKKYTPKPSYIDQVWPGQRATL